MYVYFSKKKICSSLFFEALIFYECLGYVCFVDGVFVRVVDRERKGRIGVEGREETGGVIGEGRASFRGRGLEVDVRW